MTITISVRDYRGVSHADVDLAPIALVAGVNEQGKTSLAQATRAALAGVAIPVSGINKKDAALLVREGAQEGQAKASIGEGSTFVRWPKCSVVTAGDAGETWSSHFAVGLKHVFDLDAKERSNVLAGYIQSMPLVTDLAKALRDIGYSDKAIDFTWQAVTGPDGWDGAYKKARDQCTKLKGQWEQITGEKYGSKKAEGFQPKDYVEGNDREELESALSLAKHAVKKAVGAAAVSVAEWEKLKALSEKPLVKYYPEQVEKLRDELKAAEAERLALPAEGKGANAICKCPSCAVELVVEHVWQGPTVLKINTEEQAELAVRKDIQKQRAALDGKIANLKGQISARTAEIARWDLENKAVQDAIERINEIGEKPNDNSQQVIAAEQAESKCLAAIKAFDDKAQTDKIHADIIKNDRLSAVLAPDGLRQRKLATKLDEFNTTLDQYCHAAKWSTVRLDQDLMPHYGNRPLWAASASGVWRARVIVQVAMAVMDGSAAVVIDEADILDAKGRNGLMMLLKNANLKALVCLTINKQDLVPDLSKAGLGNSYWLAAGETTPVGGSVTA